jgi:hypothetical protein
MMPKATHVRAASCIPPDKIAAHTNITKSGISNQNTVPYPWRMTRRLSNGLTQCRYVTEAAGATA